MSLNPVQPDPAPPCEEQKECDLVMKGGITSGIVYPPLVIELHKVGYAFRSVGGTSAGAIAAAVTAAAEYGKVSHAPGIDEPSDCSFHKLNEIRKWLGEDDHLKDLFQPSTDTAPLMNTLFGYSELKALRWPPLKLLVSFVVNDTLAFIGGALLGVALSFLLSLLISGDVYGVTEGWGLIVPVVFGLIGGLLVVAWHLYQILKNTLPDATHGFGLCTGRGKNLKQMDKTVMTDWLSASINDLAGKGTGAGDAPLTFGELWGKQDGATSERKLDLRMMTSNLSQNQPYVLPFEQDLFIFNSHELLRFFPPGVVEHMVREARPHEGVVLPEGYYFLPEAKELPVIFATRMSLSFPVLISMIPLYTLSPAAFPGEVRATIIEVPDERATDAKAMTTREKIVFTQDAGEGKALTPGGEGGQPLNLEKALKRNWFSDGGICSNFPIHFFDSWLPTRPTFGVNLTSQLAKGTPQGEKMEEVVKERSSITAVRDEYGTAATGATARYDKDVYLPKPDDILPPEWIPIDGLGKFLENIFRTAQNYRDNMQSMLPSYRERIVQIRLTDDEGGLNLDMSEKIIQEVVKKGQDAGKVLVGDFRMDTHQWVRFRVLMKQMETSLNKMNDVMRKCPFYLDTLNPPLPTDFPYKRNDEWLRNAKRQLDEMGQLIGGLKPENLFQSEPPLPEPVLRVTPLI
jgi:predicted acylesterase/phospholipase RssA